MIRSSAAPLGQRLWKGRAGTSGDELRIPPRDRGERIPLAFAQEPMWLAQLIDPDGSTYNQFEAFRLRGRVDAARMQGVLDQIVARHEILRTAFRLVDGEPAMVVLPSGSFPLETVERRDLAFAGDALRAQCASFIRRPFAPADAATARALLIRLADDDAVFVLVLHHIVRDGWAMGVLLAEISALWASATLAPVPIQYGDYAQWQRRLAEAGAFEQQRAYWKQRLAGAPLVLDLPGDHPRPVHEDTRGAMRLSEVERPVTTALRELASRSQASLFMTLAAAFQVFQHRYTGEADLLTGFPVSGRVLPETEPLIGNFINTCVLRTNVEPDEPFRALLARVRGDAFAAYDNQDFPFDKLVEELRPVRRPGQNPVVQTLVTRIDPRRPALRLPGVIVEPLAIESGTSKVDLALEMFEHADGLTCRLEYRTAMFEQATAARMLGHFGRLLESIARDPDTPVGALRMLSDAERDTIVNGWNHDVAAPSGRCAHELFEASARRTPDAPALIAGPVTLSYAELDARANALALRLRAAGIGRGRIVGIYLDRSIELIVAMLGVLKSGAAYLPLDPAYPQARVAYMIADSGASAIVTSPALASSDALALHRTIVVGDGAAAPHEHVPGEPATLSDLAYVMYTSGTTGKPKGVMIEHGAMAAYIHATRAAYGFTACDRMLQFASASFDASVKEIFVSFACGASLALRDDAMIASPAAFFHACDALGITVLDAPTAYWHELAAAVCAGTATLPARVRMVVIGGEAASTEHVIRWKQVVGEYPKLYNGYGPTEITVAAMCYEVPPAACIEPGAPVSIGRPLANSRCYVLDARLQPAPVNVPGELFVGGAGLARGYLGDPALTASRFLHDPFAGNGARMYRTGDRARYLADGTIQYLGRVDRQIKLNGFRIELGEIENVLLRHASVREAVAEIVEGHDHVKRIVAFVVTDASSADVRAFAAKELPAHMVPAHIMSLRALPLTTSTKVDRAALHALAQHAAGPETAFVAPESPIEREIAAMWAATLGLQRVGLNDDFFSLGGHSLQAASLVARVNQRFGVGIPVRGLFESPTVGAMSRAVVGALAGAAGDDVMAALLSDIEAGGSGAAVGR